ncbi:hypothetical protein HL667_13410 [Bradyrhizobium sp. 83012]|uniref:Uncharacterized protein n=1 Tax=Bradyrhizobium aeschynomenes TaxID=2734909 RepID=A0ABX2CFB3_9BRAD|nr:hypothetical protein [Bradyrhizobium aeschynomenes]NPU09511.1 hypothetical protein [Bradyrhizobium aeschynomenes]NPU65994.1 hypothetical protein [Bradyrhizobium aeschynomenes]NPV20834.1 hypothetical protein [Bradyrhizobium aeschynomenes]
MALYRIRAIGSGFEVGTEEQPVLVCRSLKIARRAVADAQRLERMPPRPIPWRVSPGAPAAAADDVADHEIAIVADGPPLCC